MIYIVPIYCLITAISAVLCLLQVKLLLAFFIGATGILSLAVGDDIRDLAKPSSATKKMARSIIIAVMFVVTLWLATHFAINLYFAFVSGLLWSLLGMVIGFCANKGYIARAKRRP